MVGVGRFLQLFLILFWCYKLTVRYATYFTVAIFDGQMLWKFKIREPASANSTVPEFAIAKKYDYITFRHPPNYDVSAPPLFSYFLV